MTIVKTATKSARLSHSVVCSAMALCLNFGLLSAGLAAGSPDFDAGMKLVKSGQYQEALAYLDRCVDTDPTNGDVHFWRGKCLGALGKKEPAAEEFKLAAMLSPDKLKESCRLELAKYKLSLPKGSVNDFAPAGSASSPVESGSKPVTGPSKNDKYFKLSSKKLEWNLQLRPDFMKAMRERNDRLGKLAKADNWRTPSHDDRHPPPVLDLAGALSGSPHNTIPLTADEKKLLRNSDIMIILDHSGSMQTDDCPAGNGRTEPRLIWCVEELLNFANELGDALPHGYHLIVFDSKPDVHHVSNSSDLRQVLLSLSGGGGTNLSAALEEAFRLHTAHPQQPLLIAVVTDAEIDVHSSEQTIVNGTRRFPLPNGVFITLLQIGLRAELHTEDQRTYLNNLHRNGGTTYDAFEAFGFSKVRADGLGRDILAGLRINFPAATAAASTASSAKGSESKSGSDPRAATAAKQAGAETKPATPPSKPSAADPPPIMWPAN